VHGTDPLKSDLAAHLRGRCVRTDRIHADSFAPIARVLAPLRDGAQTQVATGQFRVDADIAQTSDVAVLRVAVRPRSVSMTLPDPSILAFVIPISWQGSYVVNGAELTKRQLFLSSGFDGYYAHADSREFFTVGLKRHRFFDTLAALRGDEPTVQSVGDVCVDLPEPAMIRLRADLAAILTAQFADQLFPRRAEDRSPDPGKGFQAPAEPFEEAVYGALLEAYFSAENLAEECGRGRGVPSSRIVRLAEDYFAAAGSRKISLADLCAEAGVSRNRLQQAFRDLYGETPLAYFHKRRLGMARDALLDPEAGVKLVKSAALTAGLTELGRFSVEYRKLFGETPSSTLRRQSD